jgi:glycosyltransferase involved in cell wall biosynthesis
MSEDCGLSIIIAIFNGALTIRKLVEELSQLDIAGGLEIVLVDDGSADNSLEVCRELALESSLPIAVVNLSRNFGEHNAIMAGLAHVRGDYVITMDDDLQNPPSEVARLYDYTRNEEKDVVYTYYDKKHHAAWRNFGSWLTNSMAGVLLDKPKDVYLSSFRCMSAFVVESIRPYDGPFPYIDGMILQVTQDIGRLKVEHMPRAVGHSNYTLRRLIRLWLNMFLNFSVMPLRISTVLGIMMSAVGLIGVVVVFYEYFASATPLGWGSMMTAILVFSGVQLLILGITGEYLGRLYLTTNRRPQFVVRDVYRKKNVEAGEAKLSKPAPGEAADNAD